MSFTTIYGQCIMLVITKCRLLWQGFTDVVYSNLIFRADDITQL